jgi:hypothetical protein
LAQCSSQIPRKKKNLFVSLSSLPAVLSKASFRRELLGLGPRSSRLDVLGGGVIDLVFFESGRLGRLTTGQVDGFVFEAVGKDSSTAAAVVVVDVARVHREAVFVTGDGSDRQLVLPADHSRKGSVEVVEVGLVGAAASAIVRSSSVAHGVYNNTVIL